MAEAIMKGVVQADVLPWDSIHVSDVSSDRREYLRANSGATVADTNASVMEHCRAILFAVKPQNMPDLLREVAPLARPEQLFLSICAGTTTATIEQGLRTDSHPAPRVIRIMPNTPALIGRGMAGICRGQHATEEDLALAEELFRSVGEVLSVPEERMNAVTALAGSGPAYVFYLIEAMIDAAQRHGFSPEEAARLVLQTVRGGAELAHGSALSPAQLRRNVTSPGGTTAAGIAALEDRGFHEALIACIDAAEKRGKELEG